MTSSRAGGLKTREPLKADYKWYHLKVAFPLLPGPGGKDIARGPQSRRPCYKKTGPVAFALSPFLEEG